jgi:hypothetical protein
MSAWFYYYHNNTLRTKQLKGFATLPCRKSKHTAAKAPMAHKTFSQEQFIVKYYFLTFRTTTKPIDSINFTSVNNALLISNIFYNASFFSGTNLFLLYRARSWFSTSDTRFLKFSKLV